MMKDSERLAADWRWLDWQQPWMHSLRSRGIPVLEQVRSGLAVYAALNQGLPPELAGWRFVPQSALPEGQAYESFIRTTRQIPTRDNWHDLLNGLIWLHWPRLKQHLNALQAAEIARDGVGGQRGRLRDALTVLDENGALWLAPQPLIDALQARDWRRLMVDLRPLWADSCLLPLGHALLEKLLQPRKPVTAHVLCRAWSGQSQPVDLDRHWAADSLLSPESLRLKPFSPLPVLGVPGWWPQNGDFSFYDDPLVFRGPRPTINMPTDGRIQVTAA